MSEYAERDVMALDAAGEFYVKHVTAMTAEGLHSKADIAAELAWRDSVIEGLKTNLFMAAEEREDMRKVAVGLANALADINNDIGEMKEVKVPFSRVASDIEFLKE